MLKIKNLFYGLFTIPLLVPLLNNNIYADQTILADGCVGQTPTENCFYSDGNFSSSKGNFLYYYKFNESRYLWGYFWNDGKLATYYGYGSEWTAQRNGISYILKTCLTEYGSSCNTYDQDINDFYNLNGVVFDSINRVGYDYFNNGNDAGSICFNLSSPRQETYCMPGRTRQTNVTNNSGTYFENIAGYENITFSPQGIATISENAPNFAGGGGNEEQTVGCMNIKTQIMMYGASYNTGLCYTNNKQRSGSLYTGERVTVTPKSIFEIFTGFDSYKERRNIYENSCHAPYTQEYCLARMQGNQEATEFFTKIDNAINNAGLTTITAEKVYQYCHLQLNFTEEEKRETTKCQAEEEGTYYATGITAEGGNQNPIEGLTNIILEEGNEIILPNDGTVFDQILPEGIISWKDFAVSKDNLKEALNIAVKFMSIFMFRPQKEGILPEYISSLILIFVFYQIIRRRTGK